MTNRMNSRLYRRAMGLDRPLIAFGFEPQTVPQSLPEPEEPSARNSDAPTLDEELEDTRPACGYGANAQVALLPERREPERQVDLPLVRTLGVFGHSADCIMSSLSGYPFACRCRTENMDDPAVAVALALQFATQARRTGIPIPSPVIRLLRLRIEEGDCACLAVGESLVRRGLLTSSTLSEERTAR